MIQSGHQQINTLVAQGLLFHQQGDLVEAENAYLAIVEQQPQHADALHLLGVLKGQQGLHAAGIRLIERAIIASPRVSAYYNNLGNLRIKTGDLSGAEKSYRYAIKIDRKNPEAQLNLGKMLHDQGQLQEAKACLIASLRIAPRSVEAQMSLGRLEESAENLRAALESYGNAARIAPDFAPAHLAMGNIHQQQNAFEKAEGCYRAAIAADSNYADAYFNLANSLRSQGKLSQALAHYRSSIRLSPASTSDAYNNLGLTLSDLGQHEEALAAHLKAVELSSSSDEAWFNLGKQALRAGDPRSSEQHLLRAISLNPRLARAHLELGNLHRAKGNFEEASEFYRNAIRISPSDAAAYNNLGTALSDQELHEEAQEAYRAAIALRPDFDDACFNLGKELTTHGDEDAGMEMLRRAIAINPKNAAAHLQVGVVLQNRGFLADAAQAYRRSLDLDGDNVITRSNLGLVLSLLGDAHGLELLEEVVGQKPEDPASHWHWGEKLLLHGDFERGWEEYEWRMRVDSFLSQHRAFTQPLWSGEPLDGMTILLYAEQGQGDTIQFARYAKLVADRGGRVVLEVQPSLHRLLERLPGVSECIAQGEPQPEFATFAPLMSLPCIMGTRADTIPAPVAPAIPRTPRPLREFKQGLQVGIVWAGNAKDKRDRLRSTRLTQWAALADIAGIEFTSLQAGEAATQAQNPGQRIPFVANCGEVKDFADTAAMIADLDLVVTVDTAVAHLAGTMGKPVWILLYNAVDWRWGLYGDTTPWYPTARLFRQTTPADWTQVMTEVASSLRQLADSRNSI